MTAPARFLVPSFTARRRSAGFGLLEILVVLGLIATLAALAAPSLNGLWLRRSVQAAGEALVADLRRARSEAIQRGAIVAVCASADGQACSASPAWRDGWIVFVDTDANRRRDSGEELIRVQSRLAGLSSVASAAAANDKSVFSYHPTGWAKAASQTLLLSPNGRGAAARVVCISSQGRPTLRPEGWTQCS